MKLSNNKHFEFAHFTHVCICYSTLGYIYNILTHMNVQSHIFFITLEVGEFAFSTILQLKNTIDRTGVMLGKKRVQHFFIAKQCKCL